MLPNLVLRHTPAHRWYQRTQWELITPVTLLRFEIPTGFVTDVASVPRMMWWLFPPSGRDMAAALLHDYLLQSALVPRATADHLFLEAMTRIDVATWQRITMFAAVRVFGIIKGAFSE